VAAETAFKKMYDSGAFSVGDDASTYRSKFTAGEIGMVIDNSSALLTMVKDNKVVPPEKVGASALPFPTSGSVYAGFAIGINAKSKNTTLAKDFIHWMYTKSAQDGFAEGLFPSSVGTDAKAPQDLGDANPWVDPFFAQLPDAQNAVVAGYEVETPIIRKIVLTQIERILTQDVDPQEALDQAQEEAEAAVD
jgi:multiple sugar transport system substrate-binding protein